MPTHNKKRQRPQPQRPHPLPPQPSVTAAIPTTEYTNPGDVTSDDKYAITSWGGGSDLFTAEDLTVPSGQLCRVRRPGVQGLMAAGVLERVDGLSSLVDRKHIKRVERGNVSEEELDAMGLLQDPEAMRDVLDVMDKVTVFSVVAPRLDPTPVCKKCGATYINHFWDSNKYDHELDVDLDASKVYIHQVDFTDKVFILNFAVGGTRSLERFRVESQQLVERLEPSQDVEVQA